MRILDSYGRPLRRAIGFVGGYVLVGKALPLVDALSVVGVDAPADASDEDESDAARASAGNRTRRAG